MVERKTVFISCGQYTEEERDLGIQFDAGETVAHRLWQLAGSPSLVGKAWAQQLFQIEVRIVLLCEVLGLEKEFEETKTVQVDPVNWQITGIS